MTRGTVAYTSRECYTVGVMEETSQPLTLGPQMFRDIFDACPVGIAIENLDGQPLFVSRSLCSMLGFTEDELCSKHGVSFSPAEDAEKNWVLFQQLRAGSLDHYQLENSKGPSARLRRRTHVARIQQLNQTRTAVNCAETDRLVRPFSFRFVYLS